MSPRCLLSLLAILLIGLQSGQLNGQPSYVPSEGLVTWYPFNGNALDESNNNLDGSINGAVLTNDRFGEPNSAYSFDGIDDYINSPIDETNPLIGHEQGTLSLWFKSTEPTGNRTVFAVGNDEGENDEFLLSIPVYSTNLDETYPMNFRVTQDDLGISYSHLLQMHADQNIQQNIFDGSWHHIVCVVESSNNRIYVDGEQILVGYFVGNSSTEAFSNILSPKQLTIGCEYNWEDAGERHRFFGGELDDIAIWDRALTEVEISNLYTGCISDLTPMVSASGSTTFCNGGFVQLTASAADSYLWNNGATTQTITVTEAGEYIVTVFDGDGCSATSEPIEVVVNDVPSAAVNTSGSIDLCSGETVTLTALGAGSYLWSNGATSQSIEVSDAGSYSVMVTNNGCSATSQPVEVTVTATPEASVVANGPAEFCEGGFVQLTAQGEGTYQWNTGATTQSITVSEPGNYSVIVSNNGCSDISDPIGVTVNPLPVVSLNGLNDICENSQPVELSGGSPSGGWYTLNGETANEINPSQTGPGMQSIGYSFTDGNGCSNSSNGAIMVNAVEPAEIFGLNSTYLPGDGSSELSAEPAGGVFGGAIVSGNIFDPNLAGPGTHSVSYAIVDENGCISLTGACTTVEIITGGQYGDNEAPGVRIYPNPASTIVTIEHPFQNARVEVINAVGQLVLLETLASSRGELVIGDLPMGMYQLRLIDQSGMMTNIPFVKK